MSDFELVTLAKQHKTEHSWMSEISYNTPNGTVKVKYDCSANDDANYEDTV